MRRIRRLIREAHRRSLWRVVGFYLAGAWVALQVVQTLTASLGLPDWVPPASVALLVAGFPIVTATAVVQEGGPGREREGREDERGEGPSAPEAAGPAVEAPSPAPSDPAPAGAAEEGAPSPIERVLSWPNALLGGVAAFSLLGLVTALYMASRLLGVGPAAPLVAKGVLEEREPIVLARFESATGDSLLAVTATEALRIDLSQSPVVRLADPGRVREALRRMRLDADTRLTVEVARELAVREGLQAVIGGELNRAGRGYLITAQVVSAGGSVLTSHRVSAPDSTEIIPAIDDLSRALRKKIGESIKSVRASPPLARVTTTSLEALRKYSQAEQAEQVTGERDRALALLEEAIALDSTFAMAWRKLGVVLFNRAERPELRSRALTKAHELRDRLTEVEEYHAVAAYHLHVTEDFGRARTAYENLLEVDPDNTIALNNLAFIYGGPLHEPERAEPLYREAARSAPSDILVRMNLAGVRIRLGKLEAARATLEEAEEIAETPPPAVLGLKANLAAIEGRWEAAHATAERLLRLHGHNPYDRSRGTVGQASLYALRGRLAEAVSRVRTAMAATEDAERRGPYLRLLEWLAGLHLHVRRDTARALELMERASGEGATDLPGTERSLALLRLHAHAGRPGRAREVLRRIRRRLSTSRWALDTVAAHGVIALAEGRAREAVRHFREVESVRPYRSDVRRLGEAHDRAGAPDSAIAHLRRYLRTHHENHLSSGDSHHLPRLLRRLGELEEARGERAEALEHYRRYVELWSGADPELRPRVDEVRERIEAIEAEESGARSDPR